MKYEIIEDDQVTYSSDHAPDSNHIGKLLVKYGLGRVGLDKRVIDKEEKIVFYFLSKQFRSMKYP